MQTRGDNEFKVGSECCSCLSTYCSSFFVFVQLHPVLVKSYSLFVFKKNQPLMFRSKIRRWLLITAEKMLEVDSCNTELLSGVGRLKKELGKLSEAMDHYKECLRIKEAEFGCDHPQVAATQDTIGLVLRAQGKLPEALEMHEKALETRVAVLGPEHPAVADTKNK